MLTSGTILQGRYRILRPIGGGGMGQVYLAEDTRLAGRQCAVKEMSPNQEQVQDRIWSINAFQQEARILAHLQHPGLTPITDFFGERENWYLVMEYVKGWSLEETLSRSPQYRLPIARALNIFQQLCRVLDYLHGQTPPVVFRDLKPSNVMLTPDGQVKLIDFGIARFFKPGQGRDTVNLGTPGYAAPEQYGGHGQTDVRADVYALGVLLHQMLTGYDPTITPFRLPTIQSLNTNVRPEIAQAIHRATAHEPDQRFPSVRAFYAAVQKKNQAHTAPLSAAPAIPRWLMSVAGASLIIALIVIFLVLKPAPTDPSLAQKGSQPAPTKHIVFTPQDEETPSDTVTTAMPEANADATQEVVTVVLVVTATPAPIETDTPEATVVPSTATPIPSPSPLPTASPTCPAVTGPFAAAWASTQEKLGCATTNATTGLVAEEAFEGGKMFWREPIDFAQAVVVFNNGTWRIFTHEPFVEGSPEFPCADANTPAQCPPTPKRGFGTMWCDIPDIRNALGNALECERGYQGMMQEFENGFTIRTDNGAIYLFYYDTGQWERR